MLLCFVNVSWNFEKVERIVKAGTIEKTSDLSTQRSQRAQSLSLFQTPLGSSNVSAFSARSAVKLESIVISLEKSIVPAGQFI